MMTDKDLVEFASDFREGILDGGSSGMMCAAISWPLASLLNLSGVQCECVEVDIGHCNHIWIKLADGRALDATADQFNWAGDSQMPPVYLGPPTNIHGVMGEEKM